MSVEVLVDDRPKGFGEVLLAGLPIMRTVFFETLMTEQSVVVLLALFVAANKLHLLAMQQAWLNVDIMLVDMLELILDDVLRSGLTAKYRHNDNR